MSEVAIVPLAAPGTRFVVKIRDPGIVRHVAFERRQKLVMSAGQAGFEEVPVLFIEGHKNAPIREHRFAIVETGEALELEDGEEATWRATNISAGGRVVHVFEIEAAS